eukprot:scaffold91534_cov19-Tisochrysis_lutea.AAC.5
MLIVCRDCWSVPMTVRDFSDTSKGRAHTQVGGKGVWIILEEALLEFAKYQHSCKLADVAAAHMASKSEAYDLFEEVAKALFAYTRESIEDVCQGEGACEGIGEEREERKQQGSAPIPIRPSEVQRAQKGEADAHMEGEGDCAVDWVRSVLCLQQTGHNLCCVCKRLSKICALSAPLAAKTLRRGPQEAECVHQQKCMRREKCG